MAPETRSEAVQMLEDSRAQFLAAAGGLSEAEASAHPIEGCWSVLDCVEHVIIAEERFQGRMESATKSEVARVDHEKETNITATLVGRKIRVNAPEGARPTGRFATLQDALKTFDNTRTRTVQVVESRAAELTFLEMVHPFFGKVNGSEMVRILAGHTQRHASQILEVRAALSAR